MGNQQGRVPYEYVLNKFKDKDPKEMAELSGTYYDEINKSFKVRLMGEEYTIFHPSGDTYNEDNVLIKSYTIKIIFLRYLVNAKGIPPTNKDITFKEIPGGHVYYNNFNSRTISRLATIFKDKLDELENTFINMKAEKVKSGDLGYKFEFINNVYMTFLIWNGEEGLPPSANILFDFNTQYYFDAEDLAVVGDVAIEIAKNNGTMPLKLDLYNN